MGSTSFTEATWAERSVFVFFMFLWIVYGLLNQLAKHRGLEFNAATLVWVQEVLKLVLSMGLFGLQDGGLHQLLVSTREHWIMLCWYMIPAGLYALTDVLTYINLRSFDPATYYLLSEMKLVLTAVIHQVLFQRRLNVWHWIALGIITMGCVLKTVDSLDVQNQHAAAAARNDDEDDINNKASSLNHPTCINYVILLFQIFASTVAGVYNEKLLKDKPSIPINLQNMCLYLDGIFLLTLGSLTGLSSKQDALAPSHLQVLLRQPTILAMAVCMSTAGLVTSRFLKVFDSVRKSIAAALVVVALPFLSNVMFGTNVTFPMVLAIASVVLGMYIYSAQPAPGSEKGTVEEEDDGDAELFLPALSLIPRDGSTYMHLAQSEEMANELDTSEDGATEKRDKEIELSLEL